MNLYSEDPEFKKAFDIHAKDIFEYIKKKLEEYLSKTITEWVMTYLTRGKQMRINLFRFMLSFSSLPLEDANYKDGTTQDKMIWFRFRTPWTKPIEPGKAYWWDVTIANLMFSIGIWDCKELRKLS
jgi:hypothetical protein